jgi:hypothetical protein
MKISETQRNRENMSWLSETRESGESLAVPKKAMAGWLVAMAKLSKSSYKSKESAMAEEAWRRRESRKCPENTRNPANRMKGRNAALST